MASSSAEKRSVLFVCLGNICRSPMAEAVFKEAVSQRDRQDQFEIDSAAVIDYHVGKTGPEPRATKILEKHGIKGFKHPVRQVTSGDFSKYDFIFGMDKENIQDLMDLKKKNPDAKAQIELFGKFDEEKGPIIEDPYYDLLTAPLNWPLGAVIAQACHATTAVLWEHKEDPEVLEYMKNVDSMTKICLQIEDGSKLEGLAKKLEANGVAHKLWVEQPENFPVCIAVKPTLKSTIQSNFKGLKLYS